MKKQIYTIQILSDKEFEGLHKQFSEVDKETLKTALGFANKETGEAYVRKTSVAELDASTMQHELQELISKNSEHEDENNIRWKKGKDVLKSFLPAIVAGAGQLIGIPAPLTYGLAAGTGAVQGYQTGKGAGALRGGALGALSAIPATGAVKGATAAAPGFLSKAGGAIKGALGITPTKAPTGTIKPPLPGGPLETYTGGGSVLGSSLVSAARTPSVASPWVAPAISAATRTPTAGPLATPTLGTTGPRVTPPTPAGGVLQVGGPGPLAGGPSPVGGLPPTPAPKTFGEQAKDLITPQNILGAGSLLGSAAIPSPEFQMPSSIEDIRQKILAQTEGGPGGLTELGKQAQTELGSILTTPAAELYPTAGDAYYDAALRRTRENYERAQEELDKVYNQAGVFGTGEHLAQQSK